MSNLSHNLEIVRSFVGPKVELCAAVKADAYGHGAVEASRLFQDSGVSRLGVATVEEAFELRASGVILPIVVFGVVQDDEIPALVSLSLESFVFDDASIDRLAAEAQFQKTSLKVHLKIDTGMGRVGALSAEAARLARKIVHSYPLEFEGLCTHFASSDAPGPVTVADQLSVFRQAIVDVEAQGLHPRVVHAANSGAIVSNPESHYSMVRPGIMLYGYGHSSLKPVMRLTSRVAFVNEVPAGTTVSYGSRYVTTGPTKIAGIGIGYADGYRRSWTNAAPVWIARNVFRVSGTVCMDQILVDVGPNSSVKVGDEAILFGPRQDGNSPPDAQDLAELAQTIPYEILCGIGKRVPRVYLP